MPAGHCAGLGLRCEAQDSKHIYRSLGLCAWSASRSKAANRYRFARPAGLSLTQPDCDEGVHQTTCIWCCICPWPLLKAQASAFSQESTHACQGLAANDLLASVPCMHQQAMRRSLSFCEISLLCPARMLLCIVALHSWCRSLESVCYTDARMSARDQTTCPASGALPIRECGMQRCCSQSTSSDLRGWQCRL